MIKYIIDAEGHGYTINRVNEKKVTRSFFPPAKLCHMGATVFFLGKYIVLRCKYVFCLLVALALTTVGCLSRDKLSGRSVATQVLLFCVVASGNMRAMHVTPTWPNSAPGWQQQGRCGLSTRTCQRIRPTPALLLVPLLLSYAAAAAAAASSALHSRGRS